MVGFLSSLFGCGKQGPPDPTPTQSEKFKPGQVWQYHTRAGEEGSRLIIGRVEQVGALGTVLHIKLIGLSIKNLHAPEGVSSVMSHAPVTEAKLSESVSTLLGEGGDLDGFQEGYDTWLTSYKAGKAGVFTIPISEIVDCMDKGVRAVNAQPPSPSPQRP